MEIRRLVVRSKYSEHAGDSALRMLSIAQDAFDYFILLLEQTRCPMQAIGTNKWELSSLRLDIKYERIMTAQELFASIQSEDFY